MAESKRFKRENIIFALINTEQNLDMLRGISSRRFNDLSIVYRYIDSIDEHAISSCVVNRAIAAEMNLTEKDLFDLSYRNTIRLFPFEIKDMYISIRYKMHIISNNRFFHGAAAMLYIDELEKFTQKLGQGIYILPSSINEVLAIPENMVNDPNDLALIVSEVNNEIIAPDDFLSNYVYYYGKGSHILSGVAGFIDI